MQVTGGQAGNRNDRCEPGRDWQKKTKPKDTAHAELQQVVDTEKNVDKRLLAHLTFAKTASI